MITVTITPITAPFFRAQAGGRRLIGNHIGAAAVPGVELTIDPKPEQYVALARGGRYYTQGIDGRCWAVQVPPERVTGSWAGAGIVAPLKAREVHHAEG
jgi:hypothetical protein